jgi:hypothetical protein
MLIVMNDDDGDDDAVDDGRLSPIPTAVVIEDRG